MKIKKDKKIQFFTAITLIIGSVIGAGIFIKNGSIANITDNQRLTWMMSWIVGGVLALFISFSFIEISLDSKKTGLGYWSTKHVSKRFGKLISFNYKNYFFPLLIIALAFFMSEMFFKVLVIAGMLDKQPELWVHVIVSFSVIFLIIVPLKYTEKYSRLIQNTTVFIKVIPLIVTIIIAFVFVGSSHATPIASTEKFSFSKMFIALPAVLWAYECFLNSSPSAERVKGGNKTIAKSIGVAMLIIFLIYTIFSILSVMFNSGSVDALLSKIFGQNSAAISIAITSVILISLFGSLNGGVYSLFLLRTKELEKKKATNHMFISLLVWSTPLIVLSILYKTDSFIDLITSYCSLTFFVVYSIIILMFNFRKVNKTKKISSKFWRIFAITISTLIIILILSIILYFLLLEPLIFKDSNKWGFFDSNNYEITYYVIPIIDTIMISIFFMPLFLPNKWIKTKKKID